jgi:hypothetical protein
MKEKIITEIRQALKDCVDEKTFKSSHRYFKEDEAALVYGVGMKEVGLIGKEFYKQIENNSKKEIFEIADILLLDKEDMVQKGFGWMLKAASETYKKSETYQMAVFDYVMSKKAVMTRTALRYAIEKIPQELRKEAMKK